MTSSCDECMICCEKFNKQLKSKVVCNNPSCEFSACKSCIRHYLINSTEDIHCMSCRKAWDNTFVILNLNRNWFKDTYIPHHVNLLFERNKGRVQEVMQEAQIRMEEKRRFKTIEPIINENHKKITAHIEERKKIKKNFEFEFNKLKTEKKAKLLEKREEVDKIKTKYKKGIINEEIIWEKENEYDLLDKLLEKKWQDFINSYHNDIMRLNLLIRQLGDDNVKLYDSVQLIKKEKKREIKSKFIMPCQHENCKGFLNENYICGLCNEKCCKKCFEMLGNEDEIKNHKCNKEQVETAEFIKSTTKPCPKCGQRIYKVSGCDQMWCIECKCPFSWKSGEIVNGVIHNPHYFQYLRENSTNGEIPRQPGDNPNYNPCEDNNTLRLITRLNNISKQLISSNPNLFSLCIEPSLVCNENKLKIIQSCDMIISFNQTVAHIENVTLRLIRNRIEEYSNYQGDLVSWIVKDIDDENYKEVLKTKHKHKNKEVDKGYIYEMYVNVGKDILLKLQDNLHKAYGNVKESHILQAENEIMNFISYFNEQNKIISVSHNCKTNVYEKRPCRNWSSITRDYYRTYELHSVSIHSKISDIKGKNI